MTGETEDPPGEDRDEQEDRPDEPDGGEERKPSDDVPAGPQPAPGITAPLDHVTDEERSMEPVAVAPAAGRGDESGSEEEEDDQDGE